MSKSDNKDAGNDTLYLLGSDRQFHDTVLLLMKATNTPVEVFTNATHCAQRLDANPSGCVLAEVEPPEYAGLVLLKRLRAEGNRVPLILIASKVTHELRQAAIVEGANLIVEKPLTSHDLVVYLRPFLGEQIEDGLTHTPGNSR